MTQATSSQVESYKTHPAAEIFREMARDEYEELVKSIKENGLEEDIVMFDGMILDGRHRLRACIETGVKPQFKVFTGSSPARFVWMKNLSRRHLNVGERAAAAFSLEEMLAKEAKERMAQGGRISARKGVANPPHPEAEDDTNTAEPVNSEPSRTREKLAAIAHVSPRTMQDVKTIANENPEIFKEVKDGKRTVNNAMNEIRKVNATDGSKAPKPKKKTESGNTEKTPAQQYETLIRTEPILASALAEIGESDFVPDAVAELNEIVNRLLHAVLRFATKQAKRPGTDSVTETLRMEMEDAAEAMGFDRPSAGQETVSFELPAETTGQREVA